MNFVAIWKNIKQFLTKDIVGDYDSKIEERVKSVNIKEILKNSGHNNSTYIDPFITDVLSSSFDNVCFQLLGAINSIEHKDYEDFENLSDNAIKRISYDMYWIIKTFKITGGYRDIFMEKYKEMETEEYKKREDMKRVHFFEKRRVEKEAAKAVEEDNKELIQRFNGKTEEQKLELIKKLIENLK